MTRVARRSLAVFIVAALYYMMMLGIAFHRTGILHFGEAALATLASAAMLAGLVGIALLVDRLWR